jgi:hypothetical protein
MGAAGQEDPIDSSVKAESMQVVCSKCGRVLAGDDLNVVKDIARCARCGEVFALSSLVEANAAWPVDLDNPPRGAWYRGEFNGFVVGATTRHPMALFLVPFMCVWSGFSLGGIYGTQIVQGRLNLLMSLFGIPFILGTLLFGWIALMAVFGKVVVRVSDSEGVVFTGIGPVGLRRPFNPCEVTTVRVEPHLGGYGSSGNNWPSMTIVLDGARKVRFGGGLREARRDFLANVLRQKLVTDKGPRLRAGQAKAR